ncbi:hypothetical protein BpHYR1_002726 [Brachionus plicatilis]|uniref:Uncharacterized protein n=1 Tax=Brachionus plicatilis TaxID=10195 RepID=A0A3M7QB17_BRAPC|nr:hypothetical protein BpHYR1_002726 [Brachionus plicatilis]
MWGLKLSQNRALANQFFAKLQDKTIAPNFLKSGVARKWLDQQYLAVHVYKYIKNISVIHDSYLCNIYHDSTPYPSKRKGNCFVATQTSNCSAIKMLPSCPKECRPHNHQD